MEDSDSSHSSNFLLQITLTESGDEETCVEVFLKVSLLEHRTEPRMEKALEEKAVEI